MTLVNIDRGRADAIGLAKTLEELSRQRDAFDVAEDDNLSDDVRADLEGSYSYSGSYQRG